MGCHKLRRAYAHNFPVCTIHSISAQTSHEGIKCNKTRVAKALLLCGEPSFLQVRYDHQHNGSIFLYNKTIFVEKMNLSDTNSVICAYTVN